MPGLVQGFSIYLAVTLDKCSPTVLSALSSTKLKQILEESPFSLLIVYYMMG